MLSILSENAAEMICSRIDSDTMFFGEEPDITGDYLKKVFLDPPSDILESFNDLYCEDKEEAADEYPVLTYLKDREEAVLEVVDMGVNHILHNAKNQDEYIGDVYLEYSKIISPYINEW